MREILFRGKRVDNDEWVEGSFCRDALEQIRGDFLLDGYIRRFETDTRKMEMYEVDRETVGQYTGLKDKNGKRIFEGDVVLMKTRTASFNPLYVRWYEETAQFLVSLPDGIRSYPMDKSWEYEVIGNVHDNPELLKGE